MKKLISVLIIILIAQSIVIGIIYLKNDNNVDFEMNEKLLKLALSDIDKIIIKDSNDKTLTMSEKGDKWILPDFYNFPVSESKLNTFSDKLFNAVKKNPVATTESAAKKLKLIEDNFEREIKFFKNDKELQTLYIGTTSSFRKAYSRVSNDNNIFIIDFTSSDAELNSNGWYDKNLLNIERSDIKQITINDITINDSGSEFIVEDSSKKVDQKNLNTFINQITRRSYDDVLGTEIKPEFKLDKPFAVFTIKTYSGKNIEYKIGDYEKDFFTLKSSEFPWIFKIHKSNFNVNINRKTITKK